MQTRTLFITGAARGIGRELVQRAVARGDLVFAAVRKPADRTTFPTSPNLHVVLMDVADTESVVTGFAEVDALLMGRPLDAIIHAAAISKPGAVEITPVSEFEEILNTNTLGSLRILKAAVPRLRGHGGRLILVTSLWGKASGALLGAYCASKHAIESLADTARRETAEMNLHVVLVEPGVVLTDMLSTQGAEIDSSILRMNGDQRGMYETLYRRYAKLTRAAQRTAISTARCAADIERALVAHRPRTRYRVGRDAQLVCFLTWLLPDRWMDFVMGLSLNRKPLTAPGKSG